MNIRLEDLEINEYKIYQDKDSFNFGIDAVLLANFALRNYYGASKDCIRSNVANPLKICDLCTGNLPIPLIMYAKRNQFLIDDINIKAFEINHDQVALCNKSISYNYNLERSHNVKEYSKVNCESAIEVIEDDIKNIFLDKEKYKNLYETFDMITCNPPYMKKGSGIVNENDKKLIARHEILITLDDVCKVAAILLKSNRKFYMVHHSDRFTEISECLKKYGLEIKKVQFVYPYLGENSNLCLIEAVKNGKSGILVLEPIIIYDENRNFTKKVLEIYGK